MNKVKVFATSVLLSISTILPAQTVELTTMNWLPYYGDSLERGGFVTALVEEALSASGYESAIEFTSWEMALENAKKGQKDAIVGGYYSEQRTQDYYYSLPIYTVLMGLIKTPNTPEEYYDSFESIDKYKIGKLKGSVIGESFDNYTFNNLMEYTEVADAVKALNSGEINLYADNLAVAKEAAKKIGIDSAQLQILIPPLEENALYLLISKAIPNAEKLRDDFNKGLLSIQSSGKYDEILAQFDQK
ncbi:substrate-binding periplasmic protein [Marinomonas algicola]|uniref:substrate-binding periplasmic protein n=1 Tax=Marinomonas algicola TaxID=2773454 RepID=UPI00174AF045|nr:transporter substrate-binding domain-containing protein [Marinomonas algicola]